jgi:uncharacterized protein (TIGR01244 family)
MVIALSSIPSYVGLHDRLATAGQPSEQQLELLAAAGFKCVVNLGLHDDPSYSLPNEQASVSALGMHYVHIPVKFSSPQWADLQRFMKAMMEAGDQKVFVHCRHNKRVPVFIALDRILRQGWRRSDAFVEMERVWKPDTSWWHFIEMCLAAHDA